MNCKNVIVTLFLTSALLSQSGAILPGQKSAISSLATSAGFSTNDLNEYLLQNYGVGLTDLTRDQGAEVIKAFQSGGVYKPKPRQKKIEKKSATFIEVGMKKQFHFRDGSVRVGEVISVSDDIATLKTSSGSFRIPKNEFLD